MRAFLGKELRRSFGNAIGKHFIKPFKTIREHGDVAYCWKCDSESFVYVKLNPTAKMPAEFSVSLGWNSAVGYPYQIPEYFVNDCLILQGKRNGKLSKNNCLSAGFTKPQTNAFWTVSDDPLLVQTIDSNEMFLAVINDDRKTIRQSEVELIGRCVDEAMIDIIADLRVLLTKLGLPSRCVFLE
jgi:hypothetical protein